MIVETKPGGGNARLAFLLGAVLVAVAAIGFFIWDNGKNGGAHPAPGISLSIKK